MDDRLIGLLPSDLAERLDHLEHLQADWDGYGAVPPTPWAMAVVRGTLRQRAARAAWAVDDVFVVPSVEGGIRLEWVSDAGRELTLIIPPDEVGSVEYYRFSAEPSCEEHIEAGDLSRFPAMLQWYRAE